MAWRLGGKKNGFTAVFAIDFIESLHQSVSPLNATTVNQPVLLSGIRRFQANQGYAGSFIPAVWSVDGRLIPVSLRS